MLIRTTIKSLIFILILTSTSFGQLSAIESFDYSLTTLAGKGSAANGFGGPWVNDEEGGIEGLVTVGNNRFAYADLNWEVPHDTIHLQVVKNGMWSDHNRYKRPLAQLYPNTAGASYWVSYLLDVKEPLPVGNTYFMVKLYDGTTEVLAIGKGGGADTPVFTCGSGWPGNAGDDLSAVEILGGPVWLVARIDMPGNATDAARTFMWIDPDPSAEPDTADADVARNSTLTNGIDNIALEFGGDGADVRLIFDEITIATSFTDLTAESPAGTVARESFDYLVTTLAGKGSAANGFGGPWVNDEEGGIEGLVTVGNNRFAYADLNWEVPHDTIHLQVVKNGMWSDHNRYKRPLAQLYPNTAGASYWVSYLLDVKEPLPVGNTYFMVKLYDGTTEVLAIGKGGGADTPVFTCGSGWPGNAGDDLSAVEILGGPVWLVARIDMPGNATDAARTFMWIDPDPSAEPDTADADVARNSTLTNGIDNIALEFGGDGADVRLIFDEIRIGDSFAAVSSEIPTDVFEPVGTIPMDYALEQNYPNPFNPSTTISFSLPQESNVTLRVFDVIGREVASLIQNENVSAGTYKVSFDASRLSSGTYFYQLITNNTVDTRKMLLIK